MNLPKLASLPSIIFTKMPLFLPPIYVASTNKRFKFPCPTQCRASNQNSDNTPTIPRRSASFQPSIWHYDYIQCLSSEYKEEVYSEKSQFLREEVRMMLCKVENELHQLELIDVLQRLGVSYHFNNEIRNILDNIYNMANFKKENLYATSLKFRLLRQHHYDISTDVFLGFQDEMGNFNQRHSIDVEGMLSLYEASFHSLENETILDEARDFALKSLKEYLKHNEGSHLSLLIDHALELPLHWRIPRWEAHWFINIYEKSQNMNPRLLQFAKLDFNIVQTIYLEELKCASRWWERTGLPENLSFARDRLVENYIWTVGTNFEPNLHYFRRVVTKVNCLVTTIDDVYDVYGTLEELELFTQAIDRWDPNTIDNLPHYMKICFQALYNFVDECASETLQKNGCHFAPYLKKAWGDLCKSYLIEAKWYYSGYTPSLEEYTKNAWISISAPLILTHAYFLVPHSFKKEELAYLEEYGDIIRFSAMILRLANDLGTYKRENETGDIPKWIQCYMNENEVSEEEAQKQIKSILCSTWKKMNKEAHSSSLSQRFKETAINLGRMAILMYQHGDGHTIQDAHINSHILSLLIQPINDDICM